MGLQRHRQFLVIGLFALAAALSQFDRQAIAILKPMLAADLGWSDADYSTIVAWYQVSSACALLVAGSIVDRASLRWAAPLTVLGWSMAMIAQGWMRSVSEAVIYRIALGLFQGMGLPAALRTISELLPAEKRSLGFGISNASVTVGGIFAPLILPLIAVRWGWRPLMIGLGVIGIGWALAWLACYRRAATSPPEAEEWQATGRATTEILRSRKYQIIAMGKTFSDLTWWMMLFWLPDFFHRQFGLSVVEAGPPLAIAYGFSALGALGFGAWSSGKLARGRSPQQVRMTALLCGLFCVVPLATATLTTDAMVAALIVGLALFGHQGFGVTVFAIIADEARPEELGRVLGFSAFCGNMGGMLAVKATASLVAISSGFLSVFLLAPIAYAMAILLFARLPGLLYGKPAATGMAAARSLGR
ncbi:MAG: MFS transporter [Janthinobacterium lividum]